MPNRFKIEAQVMILIPIFLGTIAIFLGVIVPFFSDTSEARYEAVEKDFITLNRALIEYYDRFQYLPKEERWQNELLSERLITKVIVDPWGGDYYFDRAKLTISTRGEPNKEEGSSFYLKENYREKIISLPEYSDLTP